MCKSQFCTENIEKAVKAIKNKKPELDEMLELYEKIFILQEKAKKNHEISGLNIPEEKIKLRITNNFPLIEINRFPIDYEISGKLMMDLIGIVSNKGSETDDISDSLSKLSVLIQENKIITEELFNSFMQENESYFDMINDQYKIHKEITGFIVYNSLKPSIAAFSDKISAYLDDVQWDKGYCPVCGSLPELSVFEKDGKRFLICGFCSHKWASKRIYCPFCENSDHETLHYYSIDDEEEYRVDVCDKCRCYIKTINTGQTHREIYYPLESQSTDYIDIKFKNMGFKTGISKLNE